MIEIYGMDGKVTQLINGDKIVCVSPIKLNSKDCVQIEHSSGNYVFNSHETLENFKNRTVEKWVELKCGENPINVKPSTIVGYRKEQKGICFWISGNVDGFICTESLESFEEKLGIKKEDAE